MSSWSKLCPYGAMHVHFDEEVVVAVVCESNRTLHLRSRSIITLNFHNTPQTHTHARAREHELFTEYSEQ